MIWAQLIFVSTVATSSGLIFSSLRNFFEMEDQKTKFATPNTKYTIQSTKYVILDTKYAIPITNYTIATPIRQMWIYTVLWQQIFFGKLEPFDIKFPDLKMYQVVA